MEEAHNQTTLDHAFRYGVLSAVSWITLVVALPITLVAIYGLYFFIKADHVAPVYAINLLVSDVVQICGNALSTVWLKDGGKLSDALYNFYLFGLMASVWFMVCIAAERYIMIAYPVFFRNIQTVKRAFLVSFTVWMATGITMVIIMVDDTADTYRALTFLLPFPLLTGLFLGSWRVLSKSHSVSPRKRKQVLGTLALVLCIYMLFFLPYVVIDFILLKRKRTSTVRYLHLFSEVIIALNPVLDPVLYVFMRKDAKDILRAFPCFRQVRKCREQSDTPYTNDTAVMDAAETPV